MPELLTMVLEDWSILSFDLDTPFSIVIIVSGGHVDEMEGHCVRTNHVGNSGTSIAFSASSGSQPSRAQILPTFVST